jgi:hypothetical protein
VLFKKGETEPIGVSSSCGPSIIRSVNLEIELPKGEYVVHVRLDRHFDSQVSFPDFAWVSLMVFPVLESLTERLNLTTGTSGNSRGF